MTEFYWAAPGSGMGDRLCALAMACTYADVLGGTAIYMTWPPGPNGPNYSAHRQEDIRLENICLHLRLPPLVRFGARNLAKIPELTFGIVRMPWLWETYLKEKISIEDFNLAVARVRDGFGFAPELMAPSEQFGTFAAVHIRRTDKVVPNPVCRLQTRSDQLGRLDQLTCECIRSAFEGGLKSFFVCSDDDTAGSFFKDYAQAVGAQVVALPPMEKWRSTYYDLATMSRAKLIIQSSVSSALSHFANFLGANRLISAYTGEVYGP